MEKEIALTQMNSEEVHRHSKSSAHWDVLSMRRDQKNIQILDCESFCEAKSLFIMCWSL